MLPDARFSKEWLRTENMYYLLLPIFVATILFLRWFSKPKLNLPQGPVGLPVVGYLPFLGKEPYKTLDRLKEKYGNVFSVQLGPANVIILADYKAVEEVLGKTGADDRPLGLFDFLPDGFGFASENGINWIQHRRFVIRTMRDLGLGKTAWTSLVEEELAELLMKIGNKNGQPFNIHHLISECSTNNIISLVFGKRLQPGPYMDKLIKTAEYISAFFAQSSLWVYMPWLCNILAKVKGTTYYKTLDQMKAFNKIFKDEIELHRKCRSSATGDFIDAFLEDMEEQRSTEKTGFFTASNLIGDAQVLFIGASDTVRASMEWLVVLMAAFPEVQDRVYAELESTLGTQERAVWEDRDKFPYTCAVVLEMHRFKTIVPLNTSRMAEQDLKVLGYDIPKGSNIIANNWGLHNDVRYWVEPEKFKPERFLLEDGKVNTKPESYVPFSYGRRKCPGKMVAMVETFLYFTALIHKFRVQVPEGREPNLEGILGLIYVPPPQEFCFIPRQ